MPRVHLSLGLSLSLEQFLVVLLVGALLIAAGVLMARARFR